MGQIFIYLILIFNFLIFREIVRAEPLFLQEHGPQNQGPDSPGGQPSADTLYGWPPGTASPVGRQRIHISPLLELSASPDQKRRKIDLLDYCLEADTTPVLSIPKSYT